MARELTKFISKYSGLVGNPLKIIHRPLISFRFIVDSIKADEHFNKVIEILNAPNSIMAQIKFKEIEN